MSTLIYFLIFLLGASVGSFVNVMISRSIQGKHYIGGRSKCDYCGKVLKWFDLIPLFSYLGYRGKSRCCHKQLSWQHPMVETIFGLLFVWWAYAGSMFFHLVSSPGLYLQPAFWLITGILLAVVLVADLYYGLIPIAAVYTGVVVLLGYRFVLWLSSEYQAVDLVVSLLSAITATAFLALLRFVTQGKGMGEGDVYLVFWLGLLLGWPRIIVAIWLAFIMGAVAGVLLLFMRKKKWGQTVPFGPFLVGGTLLSLVWGQALWNSLF